VPDLAPLPRLDAWLRDRSGTHGIRLDRAVRRLRGVLRDESEALRKTVREDLASRGLVAVKRFQVVGIVPLTSVRETPAGREFSREAARLADGVRDARTDEERAAAVAAAGALVLFFPTAELAELAALLRDAPGGFGGAFADGDDQPFDLDLGIIDFPSLDMTLDGGGGGGGGDGGGGGGG